MKRNIELINACIDDFKAFARDSINDGMGEDLSTSEFLKNAMEVYIDLIEQENTVSDTQKKWSDRLKCYLYKTVINGKETWVTIPESE